LDGTPQQANLPMAVLLLENGADVGDIYDSSKWLTILHQAAMKKTGELVVLLREHKAKTFAGDMIWRTAGECDKDGVIVELFIERSLSERHLRGRDLIRVAKFFKVRFVQILIEGGVDVNLQDKVGQAALLVTYDSAAEGYDWDDAEVLDLLLKASANPCMLDDNLHDIRPSAALGFQKRYRLSLRKLLWATQQKLTN
jgi:hypothetical protein